jgi:hypothetical protein
MINAYKRFVTDRSDGLALDVLALTAEAAERPDDGRAVLPPDKHVARAGAAPPGEHDYRSAALEVGATDDRRGATSAGGHHPVVLPRRPDRKRSWVLRRDNGPAIVPGNSMR